MKSPAAFSPVGRLARFSLVMALLLSLAILGASSTATASPLTGLSATYTLDTDFDEGTLLNVNHDAPNNDQLQLNTTTTPFPFVNIAASARGTVVRIDVNTGALLGEYLTAPDGMGRNPSRTTVDQLGSVWVANRDEFGFSGGEDKGSVARIGLIIGGTRSNADGTPNPAGQYVAAPSYTTCVDRDNDGLYKTSSGLGNILLWTNAGGADTHGGISTAEDECIINYTRVTGTATRTVAVDANNDVWVGGLGDRDHEKLDGVSGQPVPGTQFNAGGGGYGGLVDGNGVLWSARELVRFVPNPSPPPAGSATVFPNDRGDYGLGIDPNTGHIWHSSLFSSGVSGPCCRLYELDGAGNVVNSYLQPFGAQGVAVDGNSHVWVAEIFGDEVWHLAPDPNNPGTHYAVGIVSGFVGSTGVAVDANGKIWVAEIGDRAARIDPSTGPVDANGNHVGAIDMTVGLGPGAGPYNYSDMTGFVAIGSTSPQGAWTVIHDSGVSGALWGTIAWSSTENSGSNITVEARAAETVAGLSSQPFVLVSNGVPFAMTGQFIEIRTTLKASSDGVSPILHDLTVAGQSPNEPPDCSAATPSINPLWPPNHKYVPVNVLGLTDPDGDTLTIAITSIFQDEPTNGLGDGDTSPDGAGVGTSTAQVRAERSGTGNGRVYHVGFTADDGHGGSCAGTVLVGVPHDQGPGQIPVDDGALYDSTQP